MKTPVRFSMKAPKDVKVPETVPSAPQIDTILSHKKIAP